MERNKLFLWFNKDNNFKSQFRTSKNATCIEKPKCWHLGDPCGFISTQAVTTRKSIRGSHIGKPRICVRLQLVQSNHCFIIVLFFRSSSTYNPHINHGGQDTLSKIFFRLQYFCPDLRLARTKTAIPIRSVKNADCRPGTKCRLSTNADCRLRIYTFFSSGTR